MDRLNAKEDNFDDLSISQEDFDDEEEMIGEEDAEIFDQEGQEVPEENLGSMEADEDLDGEEGFDEDAEEFGDG